MTTRFNAATTLVGSALVIVLASNLVDLRRAQDELEKVQARQKAATAGSQKIEAQLDALAKGTNTLAQSGNPNAQRIVATLKQNGVNIKSATN